MSQEKNIVPIVMASDENYLFPTSVAITSIMENGDRDKKYVFYFLVKPELVGMDKGLFDCMKEKYPNFVLHYLTVPVELFKDAALTNSHITVETYYRLLISELLTEYDRCLYLDGDIIVQCDVAELLAVPLEDNYLAAVKDIGMQCGQGTYYTEHQKEIGFDSMTSYFNAGVLVFNLAQIRKDNMTSKFLKTIEKRYTIEDQDILNVTCYGRVYYLPVTYNVFSGFKDRVEFLSCRSYEEEEIQKVKDNQIAIIHYASGQDKPWKNLRCKMAYMWWRYAKLVPEHPLTREKRKELLAFEREMDFKTLVEKCGQAERVILYGYTWISKELFDRLERQGLDNIRCFCDANTDKQGQEYRGVECVSFDAVQAELTETDLVVICTQKAYLQVREMLLQKGVVSDSITRYFRKNEDYYKALDKEYYDYELKEIYSEIQNISGGIGASEFCELLKTPEFFSKNFETLKIFFLQEWFLKLPLVSIVIPAYNVEKYLERCLQSVMCQTYPNWECIVINDGSEDHTGSILEKWAEKDRRFRIYTQENQGMGPTRNRAISLAKGEYVTFIDSDDWVEPDYIKDMYMAILKNHADVSKSNFYFHDMGQNGLQRVADVTDEINVHDVSAYVNPNMWCNMFDIRIFRENDIRMPGIPLEDMAIYPLLLLKAEKVVSIKKPLYHYQINTGSSVMDNVKNMAYYPKAVEYMLTEAERLKLSLKEDNRKLFLAIACRHMFGALNSRVKANCSRQEYLEYKEAWVRFLSEKFPEFTEIYDTNRYWIWGSYNLSRIIANLPTIEKYSLGGEDLPYYFGFASIIPLNEKKETEHLPISVDNAVRHDMLKKEMNREFEAVETESKDYLVLDFMEERYDLFELEHGEWLTWSEIWEESGYLPQNVLTRDSEECQEKWKIACDHFVAVLDSKFQRDHIILIESYLAPKCRNVKGRMLLWDDIDMCNRMLNEYYEYFKKKMPGIKVLTVPEQLNYTDGTSKYGTEPSYLNHEAHKAIAGQLREIVRNKINVSVIIPTYNAGKQFERLLDMLYQQKGVHDVEIVVVDSGSRDETVLTAEKRGCNVIKISQEQFSHFYSRNLGAENARYDYIVFMTQDALPENDLWIANLVRPLLENREIAASTCIEQSKKEADLFSRMAIKQQVDWLLEEKQDRVLQMPRELPEGETWETVIRKNGCINDVACAYRKDIFLQYRYRLNYAEDLDMGKRLIESGHKLMLLGSVKVIHSHNRSSMYYLRRMLVERVALAQIFPHQETAALTEQEFITGAVWMYNKVVGWINEIVEMPLEWSKNAVLLRIKDICVQERGTLGKEQVKVKACPELKDFMARMENYQEQFEGQTENQGKEKFYELYQMKMENLIDFLWNEDSDAVSMKLLIEICEVMYCLLGNVVGTLFGDMVLGTKELKYLEQEYYTLGKGI